MDKQGLMLKISKEGHSFPHYNTCKTCEEDFDEVQRFVATAIFKELEEKHLWTVLDWQTKEVEVRGIQISNDDYLELKQKYVGDE